MSSVAKKSGKSKTLATKRGEGIERAAERAGGAHLIRVVRGDLTDSVADLNEAIEAILDGEITGPSGEHDATVFCAIKKMINVRNTLSLYAAKAVAS